MSVRNTVSILAEYDYDPVLFAENEIIIDGGLIKVLGWQRKPLRSAVKPGDTIVCAATQIGKSVKLTIYIGYIVLADDGPGYLLHASGKGLKKLLREKVKPIFLKTPILRDTMILNNRGNIPEDGFEFGENGYYMTFATSGSRTDKHGSSSKYTGVDEYEDSDPKYHYSDTQARRSHYKPQGAGGLLVSCPGPSGRQWKLYMGGTQEEFHLVCPHCEYTWWLERPHIVKVEEGDTHVCKQTGQVFGKGAYVVCPGCNVTWDNRTYHFVTQEHFEWVMFNPGAPYESYRVSRLAAGAEPLEYIIDETDDWEPERYVSQVMAGHYEIVEVEPMTAEKLHITDGPPFEPDLYCVGIDVQGNRLEYSLVAFDRPRLRRHLCAHRIIARTDDLTCWWDLRDSFATLPCETVHGIAIDSSWDAEFVRAGIKEVFPDLSMERDEIVSMTRGMSQSSFGKAIWSSRHASGFWWIATDEAKKQVMIDLHNGYFTVDRRISQDHKKQLAESEYLIKEVSPSGKSTKFSWVETSDRTRNEVLDCVVGASAKSVHITMHY